MLLGGIAVGMKYKHIKEKMEFPGKSAAKCFVRVLLYFTLEIPVTLKSHCCFPRGRYYVCLYNIYLFYMPFYVCRLRGYLDDDILQGPATRIAKADRSDKKAIKMVKFVKNDQNIIYC